jgi:basic membrane protein A
MKRLIMAATAAFAIAAPAAADDFKPAVIFDTGGKFDKSFNEAAYNGAEKFKKESGVSYAEFEITKRTQREQSLRKLARRGATVIVATGFAQALALKTVAAEFPKGSSSSSTTRSTCRTCSRSSSGT